MTNKAILLAPVFLFLISCGTSNIESDELIIQRITLQGDDVPATQQIVIEFNQAVVPLGEMKRSADELPITIEPALKCQWRWMDTRTLVCQLDAEDRLSQATDYSITIAPGIETESGIGMRETYKKAFTTVRPDIRSTSFQNWLTPGTPVLLADFNMPVTRGSVADHMFFDVDGERQEIKAELPPNWKDTENTDPEIQQRWILSPRQELPLDRSVKLMIEKGVASSTGLVHGNSDRVDVEFHTFPEFEFLGVRCYSADEQKQVTIIQSSELPVCDPQNTFYLSFSSPVSHQTIKEQLIMNPDLAGGRKDYDPWAGMHPYSQLGQPNQKDQHYDVYLPEFLKAFQNYEFSSKKIIDEFGRELVSPIALSLMTSHRQANVDITHPVAVLEKNVDSQMPVYVTNLNKLDLSYLKLTVDGVQENLKREVPFPQVTDIAFAHPMPIRNMLDKQSGVVSVYAKMDPNPRNYDQYSIFAQVTPFQVHSKMGHFNSLIWVMDMATGEPVPDAKVTVYTGSMAYPAVSDEAIKETVITNADGLVEIPGLLELDPDLDLFRNWGFNDERLMVYVEKGQDIAVLPISDDFTVWGRDVYPYNRDQYGFINAWGTTAQGVYRPGDTIQYKLYVRDQDNQTLVAAPDTFWNLTITDPTNKIVDEIKDLKLNEFGAFDSEVLIPEGASVGWYRFKLTAVIPQVGDEKERTVFQSEPITVLVSDFTPAPFKVKTELNGDRFQPGDELVVSTTARLHAGGPYTSARTSVSADLIAGNFYSKHPVAKDFEFDTKEPDSAHSTVLFQKQEELDDKGDLETKFVLDDQDIIYGTLRVESSVQDDRGKSVAKMTRAKFFARDQLVGLKNTKWVYTQDEEAEVQYMVVDQKGQPVADTSVSLKIERQETKASRVKSAGNAYVTKYITDWVHAADCEGSSATDPAPCYFTPEEPGSYRITATIKDSQKRDHTSQIHAWVVGKGQVVWDQPTNNNLPIIPEDDEPKIGDSVRYLVKNPYPGGKALISIERYGILKSWVEDFEDSTEIIEFEVEPEYMPGYYLSVTVFSPRVEQPLGEGNVDLGKPAFSMGYVSVPVTDPYKQIDVEISSNQEIYKPGEDVELTFSAKPKNGADEEPVELAIVVLDEAVFDLISQGEKYFDPYRGFYSLRSLDVANFSLLTRLIGRQKFEKKGANAGGDGGGETDVSFRSIEKYVGYWNPSLVLQPGETKSVSFKAPDNLTGWRVFAMAVTRDDRLGLGKGDFKVNKEVELRQVMPNQVMQGDQFQAGFSVMNRSDTAREISVEIKATGSVDEATTVSKTVSVAPFKRQTVWLPIQSRKPGEILLTATARSGDETDGLAHTIPVLKRRVLDTTAVYGTFIDAVATTSILFPEKIHTDTGGLSVTVSPTVISNVDGAFEYMRDYPYGCWEQRLSNGVMAEHFQNLKDYMPDDLEWKGSEGLAEKMISDAANFQAPNGGMGFWIPKDEYVSPYLSAYSALAFGWLEETGSEIPKQVEDKLHSYLDDLLRRDVMPSFYDKGMASTVRAVALAALAKQGKIQLADLERFREHMPQMSLFGKAHYLIAASKVEGAEEIVREVTQKILSQSVQTAGKFQFNESLSSDYQRILATPMRTQCSILSALTESAKTAEGKKRVGDVPFKIVRAITQGRGARTHWQNTQENMFCMNALSEYSRIYEAESPAMTVKAILDDELLGTSKFDDIRDPDMVFSHPIDEKDPGRKATVSIEKEGAGRLYYTTRLQYASLDSVAERVNSGIEIRREYSVKRNDKWELLKSPMQIKRGELVRVDLFVHLPAVRNYVVIDDPVPGGLEPVNRDLATASVMDAEAGKYKAAGGSFWFEQDDWEDYGYSRWSFYHQELRHDSVRFYSDYLSPGHYHLSYTAQAIATGTFSALPAKSEEMYDPDVYGRSMPAILEVAD